MLRYIDVDDNDEGFEIVPDRSYVQGVVHASEPAEVHWTIHIEWHNPDIEEWEFREAWIEINDLTFKEGDWKDLVNREARASYEEEEVHPVMPGNPANLFYCGGHAFPNDNHVRITCRNGPDFTIEWRCNVEHSRPPGIPLELVETVTFKEMYVVFKDAASVDLNLAKRLVTRTIDPLHMGEPSVTGVNKNWVGFPVQVAHDNPVVPRPPRGPKKEPEERDAAVIALKKLGAKVKRDKKTPGNPVAFIDFHAGEKCDEALPLVKQITDLGELHLHTWKVTDVGLAHLEHLTQLRVLSLADSTISDDGLRFITKLPGLYSLHVTGSALTDRAMAYLKVLENLETLDLYNVNLSDGGLVFLKPLTKLRRLTLGGQGVTDSGLSHLGSLLRLEYLALFSTQIGGQGLIHLQTLRELKHLNIFGGTFDDTGLGVVGKLDQLDGLGLCGTAITDAGIMNLKSLKKLRSLIVSQTKVSREGAAALRKFLPKLQVTPYWYP